MRRIKTLVVYDANTLIRCYSRIGMIYRENLMHLKITITVTVFTLR